MVRHRQAELADAQWLADYEEAHKLPVVHGPAWAKARNDTDPQIKLVGGLRRLNAFRTWIVGLSAFGAAAVVVLILTVFWPDTLQGP